MTARSNWATFSYWLVSLLAIEGEPGFNDLKLRGIYRGLAQYAHLRLVPVGRDRGRRGESQLGLDGVIMFAMRRERYGFANLAGHPQVHAYATKFLPQSMMPYGRGFMQFDLLGSAHNRPNVEDAIGLKYLFPDDKAIDWVYRNAVGDDYERMPDRPDGYFNALLFSAIFAEDYDPTNSDPSKLGLTNTYFSGERALMMTRSGWDKDAVMLAMHTRQANGGHPYADRNSVLFAGKGRVWSPGQGDRAFQNMDNSVVVIDGKPQDVTAPGRFVDFQDNPLATFAAGDAKYAWDWNWVHVHPKTGAYTRADGLAGRIAVPPGAELETHSVNDFSYTKGPAYLDQPIYLRGSWILQDGYIDPTVRRPNYPVIKAFRTAGLVRGASPYALIVDDIQKDQSVHHYDWNFVLDPDLQIVKTEHPAPGAGQSQQFDLYLAGKQSVRADGTVTPGEPELLVRVLNVNRASAPTQGDAFLRDDKQAHVLDIPADAVSPDFKVLLYPFRQGDPLPVTAWNANRTAVTVTLGGVKDTVAFSAQPSSKTDVKVTRAGTVLADMSRPVPALAEKPLVTQAQAR